MSDDLDALADDLAEFAVEDKPVKRSPIGARRGAEQMRERAAAQLENAAADWRSDGQEKVARKIEDEIPAIRALLLPDGGTTCQKRLPITLEGKPTRKSLRPSSIFCMESSDRNRKAQ